MDKEAIMIRRFSIAAAILAGLAGLGGGKAYAQGSETLHASVPFEFKVGQAVLPAGRYEVSYDAVGAPGILFVRSQDGGRSAFVLIESTGARNPREDARNPQEDATLVFERQGSSYVLSKVFGPDEETGLEVVGPAAAD
jgi:hypothetical protein